MLRSILLVACTLLVPAIVLAGTYYRYTTDSGSTAFADKLDRVPERYRDKAEEIQSQSILDYPRTTIEERKERRPEKPVNEEYSYEVPVQRQLAPGNQPSVGGGITVELQPGVRVTVPEEPNAEPLRVHRRYYWDGINEFSRTQITRDGQVLVDMTEDADPFLKWDTDDVEMPYSDPGQDD